MKTRMRFIKEILFAASEDEGRAMDLMEGPEGLFPNLPERAFNQDTFALLSTLVDGVDHPTAINRLQPLRETPGGSAPKALLFEIPRETRDHLSALTDTQLTATASAWLALDRDIWPAVRSTVLLTDLRAFARFASSTGRELFLWHFLDFRRQSER